MQLPFFVLDVFSTRPFAGNQLAVIRLPSQDAISKEQKLAIAKEFNFSESVFLVDDQGGAAPRKTEIFTPFEELPFAGHPTIGTLCYIAQEEGNGESRQLSLQVLAGEVHAQYEGSTRMAEAQIPHNVRVHAQPVALANVLQSQPNLRSVLKEGTTALDGTCPLVSIVKGMTFVLVELPTVERHLAAVTASSIPVSGITVDAGWETKIAAPFFYVITSERTETTTRVRARMVEAEIGEDPATGSACCTLCSYLALQRGGASAVHVFELEQGVEMGRPSKIRVIVELDSLGKAVSRVLLAGPAVVTMRGMLKL